MSTTYIDLRLIPVTSLAVSSHGNFDRQTSFEATEKGSYAL